MSLQNLLDDIFGPGEQFPSEIYGDNLNRTFERVEQLESPEPIGEPIDGEAVTVRVTNRGTRSLTVTEIDFGEQTPTPEDIVDPGETFETTTQVPASVTEVTVTAEATNGDGGGFNSVSATRQIPADGVVELDITGFM